MSDRQRHVVGVTGRISPPAPSARAAASTQRPKTSSAPINIEAAGAGDVAQHAVPCGAAVQVGGRMQRRGGSVIEVEGGVDHRRRPRIGPVANIDHREIGAARPALPQPHQQPGMVVQRGVARRLGRAAPRVRTGTSSVAGPRHAGRAAGGTRPCRRCGTPCRRARRTPLPAPRRPGCIRPVRPRSGCSRPGGARCGRRATGRVRRPGCRFLTKTKGRPSNT